MRSEERKPPEGHGICVRKREEARVRRGCDGPEERVEGPAEVGKRNMVPDDDDCEVQRKGKSSSLCSSLSYRSIENALVPTGMSGLSEPVAFVTKNKVLSIRNRMLDLEMWYALITCSTPKRFITRIG